VSIRRGRLPRRALPRYVFISPFPPVQSWTLTISLTLEQQAVRAAIDKQVHIISMSWTIEKTQDNASDIHELESAIEAAARAGILMFCAANDQGIARDHSFPAACGGTKHIFKIGAAEASGAAWKWVGDPNDVDFIFPGHNVVKERPNDAPLEKCRSLTGSSVATAIAAGLAALVLYCVQISALNTQTQTSTQQQGQRGNAVTMGDFTAIKGHERMKEAFLAIGTSQASGNKYVEVWDVFGPAARKGKGIGRERRIEIVTEVAGRLKTRKTFE
jgi:subtilisin family serine protease